MANEFEKGKIFSHKESISYADEAVVSKHILKKETGNISLFAFAKGEGRGLLISTAPGGTGLRTGQFKQPHHEPFTSTLPRGGKGRLDYIKLT